jgi:hypothetical protein
MVCPESGAKKYMLGKTFWEVGAVVRVRVGGAGKINRDLF